MSEKLWTRIVFFIDTNIILLLDSNHFFRVNKQFSYFPNLELLAQRKVTILQFLLFCPLSGVEFTSNLQSMKLLRSWNLLCSVVLLQVANNFVSAAEGNTPDSHAPYKYRQSGY